MDNESKKLMAEMLAVLFEASDSEISPLYNWRDQILELKRKAELLEQGG